MACLNNYTLTGITADCNPVLAGISEVYLGYYGSFNVEVNTSAQTISAITAVSGAKFYKYEFAKQTGSLNSTFTKDESNGTRYYTNTLTLQFSRYEAKKHLEVEAMGAEQLVGIVKDLNGQYWFVGFDGYLSTDTIEAGTGDTYDSLNGYNLTMNAMSAYLPFEIQYSQFESLIDE